MLLIFLVLASHMVFLSQEAALTQLSIGHQIEQLLRKASHGKLNPRSYRRQLPRVYSVGLSSHCSGTTCVGTSRIIQQEGHSASFTRSHYTPLLSLTCTEFFQLFQQQEENYL